MELAENSVDAAPTQVVGRPFAPGVSGNPGWAGERERQEAAHEEVRQLFREELVTSVRTYVEARDAADAPWHPRVQAADRIVDRELGPIDASVQVNVVAEGSLMALARRLSAEDREALEARAGEYVADPDDITEG